MRPAPPPLAKAPAQCSPSLSMPTRRHLVKRQAWQALRLRLVISHSLEAGQLYSMLPARKRQGSSGGLPGPGGGPADRRALTRPGQAQVWGEQECREWGREARGSEGNGCCAGGPCQGKKRAGTRGIRLHLTPSFLSSHVSGLYHLHLLSSRATMVNSLQ